MYHICNIIKQNYKALISQDIIKNLQGMYNTGNNIFYMPEVFESIFKKEASLKYAIMESLDNYNPLGELNINSKYLDIYIDKLNGIETKTCVTKYNKNQIDNYLLYLNRLILGFMVTYNTELDIANLLINNRMNPNHQKRGFTINRLIMARIAHQNAVNGTGYGVGKYPYKIPKIASLIKNEYQKEKEEFYKNYINNYFNNDLKIFFNNIGLMAFNPFGGSDILNQAGFNIPQNNIDLSNYKPEDKIKYKIWKYYRDQGFLIAAEASLLNSSTVQKGIYKNGMLINTNEADIKAIDSMGPKLRERIEEIYGTRKSPITGKYIIDFAVLINGKIAGIECKSDYTKMDVMQLKSYYDSNELDYLYIAVGVDSGDNPNNIKNKIDSILTSNNLDNVGIILVNNSIYIGKNARLINNANKYHKLMPVSIVSPKTKIYSFNEIPGNF
ncbi:hypothetical protein [Picrophilus oshimae]|uniref:Uncharacterized protein n=1 Tax=Picrophilus torridus (strain ATCC 700027 / DSM 9790 / JCM 10055 / NBRC 100828 / KAW 2/3) TaxID=1122961 RepID=A0A8G2L8G7_PICTO|nr:hypothetical protein [Picrophilus oshimae]SMD31425.1 hypothetical protein SAMN02745355_1364 [Picrophilus oshimae DSM 9789]